MLKIKLIGNFYFIFCDYCKEFLDFSPNFFSNYSLLFLTSTNMYFYQHLNAVILPYSPDDGKV